MTQTRNSWIGLGFDAWRLGLESAAVIGQRVPVGTELSPDHAAELAARQAEGRGQVTGRNHDRRLAGDPVLPVDLLAQ